MLDFDAHPAPAELEALVAQVTKERSREAGSCVVSVKPDPDSIDDWVAQKKRIIEQETTSTAGQRKRRASSPGHDSPAHKHVRIKIERKGGKEIIVLLD